VRSLCGCHRLTTERIYSTDYSGIWASAPGVAVPQEKTIVQFVLFRSAFGLLQRTHETDKKISPVLYQKPIEGVEILTNDRLISFSHLRTHEGAGNDLTYQSNILYIHEILLNFS
jgi:hypothetical protein